MACSVNPHLGADETILANAHLANIKDDEIEIRVKVLSQVNVVSIVTLKVRLDGKGSRARP
jgi:hypothetical protein